MDFDLSDDQLALRDAAADLLAGRADMTRIRKVTDAGETHDPELWSELVGQGWAAVEVPEELGGLGLGSVEAAVLAEQVGRHVAPVPITETLIAAGTLAEAVVEGVEAARPLLDRVVSGAMASAHADERALTATPAASGPTLSGRTGPVAGAPIAEIAVVVASEADGEVGLYAAELVAEQRPPAEPAMDRTRCLGWFTPDDVAVVRLGGGDAVRRFVDRGTTLGCAELLGAAERVLEMSVEYAAEREQFGRPIGSFQAVKHRCADMLVDVEGMRSATWYAAWALGSDPDEASIAASVARSWCGDAVGRVMASALQVHGGIGFTWEHDLHLYLKRAHLTSLGFGDASAHRRRLLGLLRPKVEAGHSVV